ncbi:MAG: SIS domain-containing protein [bacterium]|jgi:fructoselysine 6-phosphate deglycase
MNSAIFAEYREVMKNVVKQRPLAADCLRGVTGRNIDRVYLIGSGGSLAVMYPIKYLFDRYGGKVTAELYSSSDFGICCAGRLNGRSLVILCSHSGNTPETVEAAATAREKGAVTIGIARSADSRLAEKVDYCFSYQGEVAITESKMLFLHMLAFGLLRAVNPEFPAAGAALLDRLPDILVGVKEAALGKGKEFARLHRDKTTIYTVGAGPLYGMAYAYSVCILLEMQWISSAPFPAAEFFHGPFEIIEKGVPLVVLVGEDLSRSLAERVVRFATKHTDCLTVVDTREFAPAGLTPEQRAIAGPFIGWAVLYLYAQFLAEARDHSLDRRRYMGVVDY